jgi:hypothetical protein
MVKGAFSEKQAGATPQQQQHSTAKTKLLLTQPAWQQPHLVTLKVTVTDGQM